MSEELKIAENINTPAERLRELSKTKEREILAAIAKNPNTPPDLLVELAGEYLDEIGFNPALDLILFENPNFIHEIFFKHFSDDHNGGKVYSGTKLPNWFLKLGLNHPYPLIRDCIAQNTDTPANYLEKLAKDEDREVRLEVARNENTPIHILEKLAEDEDDEVRSWVAYNKNTPIYILEKLAEDNNENVRQGIANNENTPTYILEKLAEDNNENVRQLVVQNKNTPIHILEKLANDENSSVRSVLASCYNDTPIYILEKLANDQDSHVRRAIANHQNTPIHILEKLAEDNFAIVRLSIANNPNINQKIIKLLFEHKNYNLNDKDLQEIEAAIELELKRLDWTEEKARKWIEERIAQIGDNLSNEKFFEFWQYLTSIESNTYPTSLRKYSFSTIIFEFIIPF